MSTAAEALPTTRPRPWAQQAADRLRYYLPTVLVALLVLVAWEVAVRAFNIRQFLLPRPTSIVQALLEQTADGLERMQRAIVDNDRERRTNNEQLAELNSQLARLAEAQTELRATLRTLAQNDGGMNEELRAEFRLLTRTLAAALDGKRA